MRALHGYRREEVLAALSLPEASQAVQDVAAGTYLSKPENAIRGSGYVVSSLEAALWCFATTGTFEQAVLRAVNLGEDADTTAAICGQIAGAFYGEGAVPREWLDRLHMSWEIRDLADRLFRIATRRRVA